MKRVLISGLLLALAALQAQPPDDVVFRAMRDELQRSMKKLQLEQMERPYFISYRVADTDSKEAGANFGSLIDSSDSRTRFLTVSVRVGDYSLDNSNFFSMPYGGTGVARMFASTVQMPIDNDYDELRRQIWLATDGAYKKALEDLSGKRAALENKHRTENTPDFSKQTSASVNDVAPRVEVDLRDAERLARNLSAVFRQMPAVQTSHVQFRAENALERFVSSEGSTFSRQSGVLWVSANASTQAADGMPLSASFTVHGRSLQDLPPETALVDRIREMGERLSKLQAAPVVKEYNGPVLFEDQAAAELVARVFAEQLPAGPRLISDNEQLLQQFRNQQQPSALLNKIGARVLPDFLGLVDDPTATHEGSHLLMGGYQVDEEGTPARKTVVVENGILKTLLTSRAPVRGVPQSTANMRGEGVAPSNLFLNASKSSSPEELKKQLVELVKNRGLEYGIAIRQMSNRTARLAYRVYPDQHEELIRNATVHGANTSSFKDILAVSSERTVYTESFTPRTNSPFNFHPFSTGPTLVSFIVPSLLFEDMTVEQPSGEEPKPPAIGHPFFAKK